MERALHRSPRASSAVLGSSISDRAGVGLIFILQFGRSFQKRSGGLSLWERPRSWRLQPPVPRRCAALSEIQKEAGASGISAFPGRSLRTSPHGLPPSTHNEKGTMLRLAPLAHQRLNECFKKFAPRSHIGPGKLRHCKSTSSSPCTNLSTSFSPMISGGRIFTASTP